ncbi:MAG: SDR family NAD(P)-dependent oxidoreductase [Pseudoruegeria sp.]
MGRVFITGVSSGIGEALAQLYVSEGHRVIGVSRRPAYRLETETRFRGINFDLSDLDNYETLDELGLAKEINDGFDTVILNAGVSGKVPARGEEFSLDELQHVLAVNVLANKLLLDRILGGPVRPKTCMVSATMAGVRFREGTLPYSVSKAALTAMAGVYAQENTDIFFAVLGLCNVNTDLSRQVSFGPRTNSFPELKSLQKRALTDNYMVTPEQRARDVFAILNTPQSYDIRSGEFVDIRSILQKPAAAQPILQTVIGTP